MMSLTDWLVMIDGPEVARHGVAEVVDVLLGKRLVEAEVVTPRRHQLRLGRDPTQGGPHRIPRDGVDHRERDRDEEEQAGDQPRHAADQERRPGVPATPGRAADWCRGLSPIDGVDPGSG